MDDGTYDVMVVDVECDDARDMRVDLVVTTGPRKGSVVSLRTRASDDEGVSLLGTPGVLTIAGGAPSVSFA